MVVVMRHCINSLAGILCHIFASDATAGECPGDVEAVAKDDHAAHGVGAAAVEARNGLAICVEHLEVAVEA